MKARSQRTVIVFQIIWMILIIAFLNWVDDRYNKPIIWTSIVGLSAVVIWRLWLRWKYGSGTAPTKYEVNKCAVGIGGSHGVVIPWIVLSILAAAVANSKGRSGANFFVLSLLLSPLIGIIAAFVAKPNVQVVEAEQLHAGTMKKCPYCAELIKSEAIVCRYCNRDVPPLPAPSVTVMPQEVALPPTRPMPTIKTVIGILFVVLVVALVVAIATAIVGL